MFRRREASRKRARSSCRSETKARLLPRSQERSGALTYDSAMSFHARSCGTRRPARRWVRIPLHRSKRARDVTLGRSRALSSPASATPRRTWTYGQIHQEGAARKEGPASAAGSTQPLQCIERRGRRARQTKRAEGEDAPLDEARRAASDHRRRPRHPDHPARRADRRRSKPSAHRAARADVDGRLPLPRKDLPLRP